MLCFDKLTGEDNNKKNTFKIFHFVGYIFSFITEFTNQTRKRFSEKPIVALTNSTVFILDFYIIYD